MGEVSTRVSALCLAIVAGLLTNVAEDIPKWILWAAIAVGTVGFFWPNIYISLWKYGRGERERALFTALIILATVTVGVLLVFRVFGRDTKDAVPVEGSTTSEAPVVEPESPPESESPRVYVRERSPREILRTLNSLPPLERPAYFHKVYDGRWVRWSGVVSTIRELSFHIIEVTVRDSIGPITSLSFRPDERSSLESLRLGDRIMYEGMIEDGRLAPLDPPLLIYVRAARILQVFPDTTQ